MGSIAGRVRTAIVSGSVLLAACSPAVAQDAETWRCTAANGQYDDRLISIAGKTVITGRINMHSADVGKKWGSTAKVTIEDSKRTSAECNCAGVVARGFRDPDAVEFDLELGAEQLPMSKRFFETPITFRISIDPQGLMTVQVGKDKPHIKTVALSRPKRDTLHLSCSGSDVSFLNIEAH